MTVSGLELIGLTLGHRPQLSADRTRLLVLATLLDSRRERVCTREVMIEIRLADGAVQRVVVPNEENRARLADADERAYLESLKLAEHPAIAPVRASVLNPS